MKRSFPIVAACIALFACASDAPEPALPFCGDSQAAWPLPTPTCQADAEFIAFREQIDRLVVPEVGSMLVYVKLDEEVRVAEACVVRGPGWEQWSARRNLAQLLASPELSASLSGPSCAAGSRLVLNVGRAVIEFVRSIERDCRRQSISSSSFVNCMDVAQRRLDQIWVYGSNRPYRVFVPTQEPAARRTALLACTEWEPASAAGSANLPPIGIARVGVDLRECMQAQGWIELR